MTLPLSFARFRELWRLPASQRSSVARQSCAVFGLFSVFVVSVAASDVAGADASVGLMERALTPQNLLTFLVFVFHVGALVQKFRDVSTQMREFKDDYARKDVMDARHLAIMNELHDIKESVKGLQ